MEIIATKKIQPKFWETIKSGKKKYEGRDTLLDGWVEFITPEEHFPDFFEKEHTFTMEDEWSKEEIKLGMTTHNYAFYCENCKKHVGKKHIILGYAKLKPIALSPYIFTFHRASYGKYEKGLFGFNYRISTLCDIDKNTYDFWNENFVKQDKAFIVHEILEVMTVE